MPKILGIQVPDEFARAYNAGDASTRTAMLKFIGRGDLATQAAEQWAMQTYGYLGGALKNNEIQALIRKAGREGWSEARVITALHKTKYWKSHAASERNWSQLKQDDPESAKQMKKAMQADMTRLAASYGFALGSGRASKMAEQALKSGVTDPQAIARMVAAEANYTPEMTGEFGATVDEVMARANQQLVPVSEATAFSRAKGILTGNDTMEGTQAWLVNLAKARWGHLEEDLDKGYTVRDLIQPNVEMAAQLLGVDPDTIDPTDPRWLQIVDTVDAGTNTHRLQTLDETSKMVKQTREYRGSEHGAQSAATLAESLLQTFGQVA